MKNKTIFIAFLSWDKREIIMPRDVLTDNRLTEKDFRLYDFLLNSKKWFRPICHKEISNNIPSSEGNVLKSINNLIRNEYMDEAEDPKTGEKYYRFFQFKKSEMDLKAKPHNQTKREHSKYHQDMLREQKEYLDDDQKTETQRD